MKIELSTNWKISMLKDICIIKKGQSITSKDVSPGTVPVIAGGQQPAYYHNVANYDDKTITVSASGAYAGFVSFFEIPIFASDCTAIIAKDNNISLKYVYYILKSQQKIIYDFQRGGGQPHVYPKDLMNLKIILPPFDIQQKIVLILEKIEKLKELQDEADKLTKDLLNAVFQEMFRNFEDTEILGNHISFLTSGSRGWAKYYSKAGDLFLRIENVERNEFNMENIAYIRAPNTQEAKRTKVEPGDILLSITADLGRTCVIPSEFPKAFINQHLAILRLDESFDPIFVAQYLTSNKGMTQINKLNKGGTKAGLNFSDIRSIKIPMPSILLQKQFASIVKEIEKMKKYRIQSKEKLMNLFNNLMQKAFKGELVC